MRGVTLAGLASAVVTGALAAAVTLTAGSGPAGAVAHGVDATTGQFPFAVKLTMTSVPRPNGTTYDSACSASLVSSEWIVTAGHCFHDVNRNPVSGPPQYRTTATIGVANLADPGAVTVDVVDVRQSPVNDVALAKLAEPVDGQALDIATEAPVAGEQLTIAGWGATDSVNPAPSKQLRYGKVAVSSTTSKDALVHGVWPQADTSACTYDSGAPYFAGNGTLVSVESDGPDCPHAADETTARVDVIASWISQQIS